MPKHTLRGFIHVELLFFMAVGSCLSALCLLLYQGVFSQVSIQSTQHLFIDLVHTAQISAIKSQQDYCLFFEPAGAELIRMSDLSIQDKLQLPRETSLHWHGNLGEEHKLCFGQDGFTKGQFGHVTLKRYAIEVLIPIRMAGVLNMGLLY